MRWTPGGRSRNLEDRRGFRGSGLRGGIPLSLGGVVLLLILSAVTGQNFLSLLVPGTETITSTPDGVPPATSPEEERSIEFVSFVLDDAQQTWTRLLPGRYQETQIVVFRDAIDSACGFAQAASGPFYCPGDRKVYIDLGFFDELKQRFGAGGDFAEAYVLAHEIGHHVQTVLGIEPRVRGAQQAKPSQGNALSVRLELQADCLAGVWGHTTNQRHLLEAGDIEEALGAAAAIGDDRIQRRSGGRVHPESFTHGSAEQRVEWFRRGFQSGDPDACDTFGQGSL
jgi:predicted metalloprotease